MRVLLFLICLLHFGCQSTRSPEEQEQEMGLGAIEPFELLHTYMPEEDIELPPVQPKKKKLFARVAGYGKVHRVRTGDTLSRIARKYKVSIGSLRSTNRIRGSLIRKGKLLKIPVLNPKSKRGKLIEFWDDLGERLAKESLNYGTRRKGKGRCLQGVRIAYTRAKKSKVRMGYSASQFARWAANNPKNLCKKFNLVAISGDDALVNHPGMMHLYYPGKCGFSRKYGHAEFVVNSDKKVKVCSDHCRERRIKCRPSIVLMPTKVCPKT